MSARIGIVAFVIVIT